MKIITQITTINAVKTNQITKTGMRYSSNQKSKYQIRAELRLFSNWISESNTIIIKALFCNRK